MTRLSVLAVAAFTLVASPTLFLATTGPAAAQGDDWGSGETNVDGGTLRDLVQSWIDERADRRDMLMDVIQERRDRRDELMDMRRERMDRRAELREFLQDHPELRERLRERLASRWEDEGDGGGGGGDLRERLRERLASRWEDEGDGGGGGLRGRLRERIAERVGEGCFFFTRILRNQDGSLLVVVRRRICRD